MRETTQKQPISAQVRSFLDEGKSHLIDGEWLRGGELIPVHSPAIGEQIGTIEEATAAQVDAAVTAARAALGNAAWRDMTPIARARFLYRLADLIERDALLLAELETLDNGMLSVLSHHMAVPLAADVMRYYAGWVTKIHGDTIPTAPGALRGAPALTYTRREPIGVVAQIIPWNFPLVMAVLKIAPALATGCTIVLKPAELGGKSPVIIFQDADLELAIPGAAMATFLLQGQNCMAGTRLFVHRKVYDAVLAGVAQIAQSLKVGPPQDPDTMIGPLISAKQKDRVMGISRWVRKRGQRSLPAEIGRRSRLLRRTDSVRQHD